MNILSDRPENGRRRMMLSYVYVWDNFLSQNLLAAPPLDVKSQRPSRVPGHVSISQSKAGGSAYSPGSRELPCAEQRLFYSTDNPTWRVLCLMDTWIRILWPFPIVNRKRSSRTEKALCSRKRATQRNGFSILYIWRLAAHESPHVRRHGSSSGYSPTPRPLSAC